MSRQDEIDQHLTDDPTLFYADTVEDDLRLPEIPDNHSGDWVVITDWIDEDFGHVQLEWCEGVFVLWSLSPLSQSKILERFHNEIFTRKSGEGPADGRED